MNYMAVDKNIAKKYARAFMLVYSEFLSYENIQAMRYAANFLKTHKKTLFFLQLGQLDEERKKEMVIDLIHYFSLSKILSSLIHLLLKHNRSFYLPEVFFAIIELYEEKMNYIEFCCESPRVLHESQINSIQKFLKQLVKKEIRLTSCLNSSLIAGLRLKSRNYLWEYSVHKHIQALQALKKQG